MRFLIVGIDSVIGRGLYERLLGEGHEVFGTSRRDCYTNNPHISYFDLGADFFQRPFSELKFEAVFIAAGLTKIEDCEKNPKSSHFINVDQTTRLIELFRQAGCQVLFPSTNSVLACDRPLQPVDAPLRPLNYYSKTKAAVEQYYRDVEGITIVRMPKIFDLSCGIFERWNAALLAGSKIEAFQDMMVSPVSLSYSLRFITKLMEEHRSGVWQLSGSEDLSYGEVALRFLAKAGYKRELLQLRPSGLAANQSPYPSMCCKKTRLKLGIAAQPIEDVLADVLRDHKQVSELINLQ